MQNSQILHFPPLDSSTKLLQLLVQYNYISLVKYCLLTRPLTQLGGSSALKITVQALLLLWQATRTCTYDQTLAYKQKNCRHPKDNFTTGDKLII